jgi:hypothetical protein
LFYSNSERSLKEAVFGVYGLFGGQVVIEFLVQDSLLSPELLAFACHVEYKKIVYSDT